MPDETKQDSQQPRAIDGAVYASGFEAGSRSVRSPATTGVNAEPDPMASNPDYMIGFDAGKQHGESTGRYEEGYEAGWQASRKAHAQLLEDVRTRPEVQQKPPSPQQPEQEQLDPTTKFMRDFRAHQESAVSGIPSSPPVWPTQQAQQPQQQPGSGPQSKDPTGDYMKAFRERAEARRQCSPWMISN